MVLKHEWKRSVKAWADTYVVHFWKLAHIYICQLEAVIILHKITWLIVLL